MEYRIVTPVELKHLKQLTVLEATGDGPLTFEVVLYDPRSGRSVTAIFTGVGELSVTRLSRGALIGPLKVLDMRDRQLENIKYKVMDFEEEHMSFFCVTFSMSDQ